MIAIYINPLEMLYKTLFCDKQNRIIMLIDLTMNVAIQGKHGESSTTFSGVIINIEERRIGDPLNCKSKNLIYLLECKKFGKQYVREQSTNSTNALGSIAAPSSTMANFLFLLQ